MFGSFITAEFFRQNVINGGDGILPTVVKGVKGDWGECHYTAEFTIPPLSVTYYLPRRTRKALKSE